MYHTASDGKHQTINSYYKAKSIGIMNKCLISHKPLSKYEVFRIGVDVMSALDVNLILSGGRCLCSFINKEFSLDNIKYNSKKEGDEVSIIITSNNQLRDSVLDWVYILREVYKIFNDYVDLRLHITTNIIYELETSQKLRSIINNRIGETSIYENSLGV